MLLIVFTHYCKAMGLFTEMYGAPLTVYLPGSWLGSRFPALRATHAAGHLWNDLIGWNYDPHLSPYHLASYALIGGGFWLIAAALPGYDDKGVTLTTRLMPQLPRLTANPDRLAQMLVGLLSNALRHRRPVHHHPARYRKPRLTQS